MTTIHKARKRLALAVALGAIGLASAAPASAAYHAGCGGLSAGSFEFCSFTGTVTHFQLEGTGKFVISLPNGGSVTSHYVSYQDWKAYLYAPGATYGHPGVSNIGCCYENYWNGYVW